MLVLGVTRRQFITRDRWHTRHLRERGIESLTGRALGALGQVVLGQERGELLGCGRAEELIKRNALGLGESNELAMK
jgi:hypothetical protein